MNPLDNLEDRICSAIGSIDCKALAQSTGKDREVLLFNPILKLGGERQLQIDDFCISNKRLKEEHKCSPGQMYDLSWYQNHADGQFKGMLKSVPLILESEWDGNLKGIIYDFEKLLIGRAKYKIMIFRASGQQKLEYFERIRSGIEAFAGGSVGDTFVLACFDSALAKFEIQTIKK